MGRPTTRPCTRPARSADSSTSAAPIRSDALTLRNPVEVEFVSALGCPTRQLFAWPDYETAIPTRHPGQSFFNCCLLFPPPRFSPYCPCLLTLFCLLAAQRAHTTPS